MEQKVKKETNCSAHNYFHWSSLISFVDFSPFSSCIIIFYGLAECCAFLSFALIAHRVLFSFSVRESPSSILASVLLWLMAFVRYSKRPVAWLYLFSAWYYEKAFFEWYWLRWISALLIIFCHFLFLKKESNQRKLRTRLMLFLKAFVNASHVKKETIYSSFLSFALIGLRCYCG